jgi:uncharacterized protein YecE (DUF72 family)
MSAGAPAAEPRIHVGTSGYSFADWVGPFYPPGTRSGDFLRHYADHFHCVEVNATYYRVPPPATLAAMAARTPPGFRFIVKLNQVVTHERRDDPALDEAFRACLEPLRAAGKFHGLLAQFPWGFRRDTAAKALLERLRERCGDDPLWVEFRHDSWMHPQLGPWLRARGLGYCAVDEPALPGLVPGVVHLTTDTGYVRFHGRNARNWWGSGAPGRGAARSGTAAAGGGRGDRYDHDYSEAELREWLDRIRQLSERAKQTYLFFNNCHAGQAARSAKLMEDLLRRERLPV